MSHQNMGEYIFEFVTHHKSGENFCLHVTPIKKIYNPQKLPLYFASMFDYSRR